MKFRRKGQVMAEMVQIRRFAIVMNCSDLKRVNQTERNRKR